MVSCDDNLLLLLLAVCLVCSVQRVPSRRLTNNIMSRCTPDETKQLIADRYSAILQVSLQTIAIIKTKEPIYRERGDRERADKLSVDIVKREETTKPLQRFVDLMRAPGTRVHVPTGLSLLSLLHLLTNPLLGLEEWVRLGEEDLRKLKEKVTIATRAMEALAYRSSADQVELLRAEVDLFWTREGMKPVMLLKQWSDGQLQLDPDSLQC